MKTIKKILMACLSLIYLVGCSSNSSSIEKEISTYNIYLDVYLEANYIFSTYDVDVYFDDDKLGKVKQGKYFTQLIENISEGKHIVEFKKANEMSPSKLINVNVNSDKTVKAKLKAHKNSIEIEDKEISGSIKEAKITLPNVTGMLLSDALEKLEDDGFLNVTSKSESNETIWIDSNWTVMSQSIEANTEIDKNTEIILTCKNNDDLEEEKIVEEEKESDEEDIPFSKEEKVDESATTSLNFMEGTSLDNVSCKAAEFGVIETYEEVYDDGTILQNYSNSSSGLMLSVLYSADTEKIIYGHITTLNKLSSKTEQLEFIKGMAPVLCPSNDVDLVSEWVNTNLDGDTSTEIDGLKYEVAHGPTDNALYFAGYKNWENWWLEQFD